ncbi:hypothetical protein [Hydrogenophaga sp. OTU3427]|uniref:hypothetical protein n=1 Tax=Hydrogenophaga sp. OTU3427 TaxID=3043856 RepID=UPI00313C5685
MKRHLTGLAGALVLAPALAAPLLVIDLQGQVARPSRPPLALLDELQAGERIDLPVGARLTLVDLADGREYRLTGGAQAQVAPTGLTNAQGQTLAAQVTSARTLPMLALKQGQAAPATLVMRDPRAEGLPALREPVRTLVLDTRPSFRWDAIVGARRYQLQLTQPDGHVVWETETRAPQATLPPELRLREGSDYGWRVIAWGLTDPQWESSARFAVADAALRDRLAEQRALAGDDFGARLFLATQLDAVGARAEAQALWQVLARERPENAVLKARAAAH